MKSHRNAAGIPVHFQVAFMSGSSSSLKALIPEPLNPHCCLHPLLWFQTLWALAPAVDGEEPPCLKLGTCDANDCHKDAILSENHCR